MTQYRKKPVVIDAFRLGEEYPDWFRARVATNEITTHKLDGRSMSGPDYALIKSPAGYALRAERGDWIIRDDRGEIYPYKPEIFPTIYEAVAASAPTGAQQLESGAKAGASGGELGVTPEAPVGADAPGIVRGLAGKIYDEVRDSEMFIRPWRGLSESEQASLVSRIRTILRAELGEPSKAMIEVGAEECDWMVAKDFYGAVAVWKAMLEEALK